MYEEVKVSGQLGEDIKLLLQYVETDPEVEWELIVCKDLQKGAIIKGYETFIPRKTEIDATEEVCGEQIAAKIHYHPQKYYILPSSMDINNFIEDFNNYGLKYVAILAPINNKIGATIFSVEPDNNCWRTVMDFVTDIAERIAVLAEQMSEEDRELLEKIIYKRMAELIGVFSSNEYCGYELGGFTVIE